MFTPLPQATTSTTAASSTTDPFAEPLPLNLCFSANGNPDSHTNKSQEAACVNKWRSDLETSYSTQQSSRNVESKKRKFSNESDYTYSQMPRRLCAHRFLLTRTGYKYLEIGINITSPAKVEIAIGDTQGKEVILTYEMWKNIIDNEDTICNYFPQNDERINSRSIRVEYLTLRFSKINSLPILRFETIGARLALSKDTVSKMIDHKFIIKNIYETLNSEITVVDSKLARFEAIIANIKDINIAKKTICNDATFNEKSKIDCELYTRIFD